MRPVSLPSFAFRPKSRQAVHANMTDPSERATRGSGLLEPLLACIRGRRADACIPDELRGGRLLDVGCGVGGRFVRETRFAEKHGVDRIEPASLGDVAFERIDLDARPTLPYASTYFQVVTMLAVVEHLSPKATARAFEEVHRVLAQRGLFVLTTPAPWSDALLRRMARVGLVSGAEIEEHQNVMSRPQLVEALAAAGFERDRIESGYFEVGLNMWAAAAR